MEKWLPIKGYENYYEVSNIGRVKSLNRVIIKKNGRRNSVKEKILKQNKHDGYLYVSLTKNCKYKYLTVHRLVAEAFIPNSENKPTVDHINTVRTDNRVENLRWCSYKENNRNELSRKHLSESCKKNRKNGIYDFFNKRVICVETGEIFESARKASNFLELKQNDVARCAQGKSKTAGGFKWEYIK